MTNLQKLELQLQEIINKEIIVQKTQKEQLWELYKSYDNNEKESVMRDVLNILDFEVFGINVVEYIGEDLPSALTASQGKKKEDFIKELQ